MSLKITESITIHDVPGLEEIRITPASPSALPGAAPVITTAATMRLDYEHEERHAQSWGIEELRQMRDALEIAINRAEQMMEQRDTYPEPSDPVHSSGFRVGQVLTGEEEDVPIGTVAEDSDKNGSDRWTFNGDQWISEDGDYFSPQHWPGAVRKYSPVTIVSLP